MKNLRNRVDVRLINNKKYYLKWTSKPIYLAQRIFDKDLVAIHNIKTTLTLNKSAYVRIYILELSKVPMDEFHYDYIKNKYGNKSRLIFTDTNILMHEIETEKMFMKILVRTTKCLILSIILLIQNITINQTH